MRRKATALVVVLASAISLAGADGAFACSCASGHWGEVFRHSRAALTAKLVSKAPVDEARADFTYKLTAVWKGPDRLEEGGGLTIRTYRYEASCGLPGRVGKRYGLFLYRAQGKLTSSLCGVISPRRMRRVAHRVRDGDEDGKWASC